MRIKAKNTRVGIRPLRRGLTLMELTTVIFVILALVALLYVGARGWQSGTDRARCILNIRQMQMSVRAYSNVTEYQAGTDLTKLNPPVNLLSELVGIGKYVPELPRCPGTGIYQFGGNVVPEIGSLYMECSLAADGHAPKFHRHW